MAALVAVAATVVPGPGASAIIDVATVTVAPSCIAPGVATRIVILGAGWANGPVELSSVSAGASIALGTPTAATSPVRQQPGSFSLTTTVTASAPFRVAARQPASQRSSAVSVQVQSGCPLQLSVKPPCLGAPGSGTVSGAGFPPGQQVPIEVDPYGPGEQQPQAATAGANGSFTTVVAVPFTGATVPIVASSLAAFGGTDLPDARAVAFVAPCPPPATTITSTTRPLVTTTSARPGVTTTTVGPPPGTTPPPPPPPPPVVLPGAKATISPTTVRPGRCAVVVISEAPPATGVVARFADRAPVSAQTGPTGGAVLSLCEPHDSGQPLGPVAVLIGLGPAAPAPVFVELRVPRRPQSPLLQSGADTRRS